MASAAVSTVSNFNYVQRSPKKAGSSGSGSDPEISPFLAQLDEALENELRFKGAPQPSGSKCPDANGRIAPPVEPGTITSGMRDGSAHVLRCLKVWYDLPSDIFFNAVSSIDRFLSKMKAQPKHLSCIAVSAFHLACAQARSKNSKVVIPEPNDLVTISQSRCSSSDLLRMQAILANKLDLNTPGEMEPVTALTLLRIMFDVSKAAALRLNMPELLPSELPDHLIYQLEILTCDSLTLHYRPAEVALALLAAEFQRRAAARSQNGHVANALMGFISELQKYCSIPANNFVQCLKVVVGQLEKYNGEGKDFT